MTGPTGTSLLISTTRVGVDADLQDACASAEARLEAACGKGGRQTVRVREREERMGESVKVRNTREGFNTLIPLSLTRLLETARWIVRS